MDGIIGVVRKLLINAVGLITYVVWTICLMILCSKNNATFTIAMFINGFIGYHWYRFTQIMANK